ncbi:hypothetical protein [Tychonema sp. LEGE 06208]|uniref:hypothetical protein n=1 Tax=Tychonema sp. LEGE 06208 TaxID=1828663 RepID=UPI001880567C|nr:hypothetical protein [Tychonema sp. LEGE 06208]MBE9164324.1 hypothetical protein [Tychonema sp. LEGE 06208]
MVCEDRSPLPEKSAIARNYQSFQRQEYCTAARSLLKCDRADFCQTPLKVAMNALTCYR